MDADTDRERDAIIAVIEAETLDFYSRDFDAWSNHWLQDEGTRRLGMLVGGQIGYHEGWSASAAIVVRIMEQFPNPNPEAARLIRRENLNLRIAGDMAWVSFDQYGPDTGDPFDSRGLSHQVRILEKHDGEWKIAFVGHGETSVGYFSFPVIRVDGGASILWMNDAARQSLPDHPALVAGGGHLRARRREDDKRLRATLTQVDNMSPMEIRMSISSPSEKPRAIPVVLASDSEEISSICWVSSQDGMLVVSYNDKDSEAKRLAAARSVYGLSPAQARLAALIIDGQDLSMAAKALGISPTTARTHLQRMFDKTGARAQSALVRVLLSVEPPSP